MSRRIRITMLSNTRGGVFSFTMNLTRMLVYRGWSVRLLFLNQSTEDNSGSGEKDPEVNHLMSMNGVPNFRTLANFLFKNDSDIVHINFASFAPLALFKKLVFKTPFFFTVHGLPQPSLESLWTNKIMYLIESLMVRFAATHASATIAVSNYVKEALRSRYGVDSKVVYHGIDLRGCEVKNRNLIKEQLGYSKNDLLILFVGNLNRAKDPLTLIRAFHRVATVRNSHLVMVGAGELSREVADTVRELGIQESVRLLGHLPHEQLIGYYSAADIFVLPSVSESFGIVLLEAMAYGLPTVASTAGACPEIIGDAGISFTKGDSADLAEKIILLIQDKELSQRLGNAGFRRVREIFPLEKEAEQYWRLFEKIVGEGRNSS